MQAGKVLHKTIGKVEIFEFHGDITGAGSVRHLGEMESGAERRAQNRGSLINTACVQHLDDRGARIIVHSADGFQKCAIIVKDRNFFELIKRHNKDGKLMIVEDEYEAAKFFGGELVEGLPAEVRISNLRKFPRVRVALPMDVNYEAGQGERGHIFAIITNLSEGGLFAEFLDSSDERLFNESIDAFDLRLLDVRFRLAGAEKVELKAKLIRCNYPGRRGIALEFYQFSDGQKEQLESWLRHERLLQGLSQ